MVPEWLHPLALASLVAGFLSALWIAADLVKHPQHMRIMNVVWPVTALFGQALALWGYYRYGRLAAQEKAHPAMKRGRTPPHKAVTPFPVKVAKGATHCGSGCTLGDVVAEWLGFLLPTAAIWFGWKSLFSEKMYAVWVLDYVFAFGFGVAFQYFTIKPMRDLSPRQGLVQALKADAVSLTAWQLGMYGFMAFAHLYIFKHMLGMKLHVNTLEFWFMMQIAMLFGFASSYPVNWWLIRRGTKEAM